MRPQAILGLVLVLAGITLFVLQLSGVFVDRAAVDVGGVELGVEASRSLPWVPWVAGGSVLVGALLMVTARK
jgi:predicted DNA repair protein MutK